MELPDSYHGNDDRRQSPSVCLACAAGLPGHGFVLCCFNNAYKITPDVFDMWMRLLRQMEGSVLWLSPVHAAEPQPAARGREAAASQRMRLVFAPGRAERGPLARISRRPVRRHALLQCAVTAADALWAGVPVLTCSGATFASPVAGSLLQAVGLPELITGLARGLRGAGREPGARAGAAGGAAAEACAIATRFLVRHGALYAVDRGCVCDNVGPRTAGRAPAELRGRLGGMIRRRRRYNGRSTGGPPGSSGGPARVRSLPHSGC